MAKIQKVFVGPQMGKKMFYIDQTLKAKKFV